VDPRRGILPRDRRHHQPGELAGRFDRLLLTRSGDAAGDPAAEAFLAKFKKNVGEALGLHPIDQPPRWLPLGGIEAQIERAVGFKRKSALVIGQLIAGKTHIEQHAIDSSYGERVEHFGEIAVIRLREAHRQSGHLAGPALNCLGIAVDRDHEPLGPHRLGE